MAELGIISVVIFNLPCFTTIFAVPCFFVLWSLKLPNFPFYLFVYFFITHNTLIHVVIRDIPIIMWLNVHQLRTEKWGGCYASFVAMFHALHGITNEEQRKKLLSSCYKKCGQKHDTAKGEPYHAIANWHLMWSAKRTEIQIHYMCIVHTVIGKKAHLGTKWHQTVKNLACSLIHCWLILGWTYQLVG